MKHKKNLGFLQVEDLEEMYESAADAEKRQQRLTKSLAVARRQGRRQAKAEKAIA